MPNRFGKLTLSISKKTDMLLGEFLAKFSDFNIEAIEGIQFRLMDGSLHSFKVEDHFIKWEEDSNEE